MPIDLIEYKGEKYPAYETTGFAAKHTFSFANEILFGKGVDVGFCKEEWKLPNIVSDKKYFEQDRERNDKYGQPTTMLYVPGKHRLVTGIDLRTTYFPKIFHESATNFPDDCVNLDFVFSSHLLEHVPDWVAVLDYWSSRLKPDGIIYLYLPHNSQRYWQSQNNRKHCNNLRKKDLKDYFEDRGFKIILSHKGYDLYNSFTIVAQK